MTQVPPQNRSLASGRLIVEVCERPLIALERPFALYRDLAPGSDGPDVEVVHEAPAELGLYAGDLDGVYGAETASAVESLYEWISADVPGPPAEAQAALDDAEEALLVTESANAAGDGLDETTDGDLDLSAARRALGRPSCS